MLRPGSEPVGGVTQALLFRRAILEAGSTFRYFTLRSGAFPLQRGTFETVISVIGHLKESGITPEVLTEELELAEPDEVHKLSDVIGIYRSYNAALAAAEAVDAGGMFRILAEGCTREEFAGAFRILFPRVDVAAIGGFDEFSEPELGFLRQIRSVPGLSVDLTFDFHHGNIELFGHLEENYRRFHALGLREPPQAGGDAWPALILGRDPAEEDGTGRSHLGARLFHAGRGGARVPLAGRVTVAASRDREEEAELVCRMIKRMALDRPSLDLSRVCVAMRLPAPYTPLFRRMFERYGIPANITDRYHLSRSPVVAAVLSLLQVAARGFRREDVLRIADSPYLMTGGKGGHAVAAVSGRLKITAGFPAWLARIDAILSSSAAPGSREGQLAEPMLREVRGLIERLHDILQPFAGTMTPAAFESAVRILLERLHVTRNILERGGGEQDPMVERDVRAFARFLDVLSQMTRTLERTGAAAEERLPFYLEALSVAVASERYNRRERVGGGVLVTAIEETRGLSMDVMFLVGLVDGEFPSVYRPEVFYSLARQKQRARRHTWEQRYLFYQAVTNWKDALVLTYPEQEGEIELVRSSFVDALLEAAEVDCRRAAELMAGNEVLSAGELLKTLALAPQMQPDPGVLENAGIADAATAVRRAVAVEQSRLETHALPAYEGRIGVLTGGDAAQALRSLTSRVFSVSQLESYGACPFQFFGTRVLRLRPLEEMREDLSPLERGSVIHRILYEFMQNRIDRNLPALWRCSDAEAAEAERSLLSIARSALDALDPPDPFWAADRDTLLGSGDRPGLLREYLLAERQRNTPLDPSHVEVAFGPRMAEDTLCDPVLSTDQPVAIGSLRLRGRVDRVETDGRVFAIIDYKTGHTRAGLKEIREGLSLQLPLYLRAIQVLLEAELGAAPVPGAGLHYTLAEEVTLNPVLASEQQRGVAFSEDSRSRQIVPTDQDLTNVINAAVDCAGGFVRAMGEGIFPLTAPDRVARVCRSCPLRTACRVQSAYYVASEQEEAA